MRRFGGQRIRVPHDDNARQRRNVRVIEALHTGSYAEVVRRFHLSTRTLVRRGKGVCEQPHLPGSPLIAYKAGAARDFIEHANLVAGAVCTARPTGEERRTWRGIGGIEQILQIRATSPKSPSP
jgi:hypothetical protein